MPYTHVYVCVGDAWCRCDLRDVNSDQGDGARTMLVLRDVAVRKNDSGGENYCYRDL